MNFIGVGPLELIVILVVALIFVGPERLPRLAADLARTIRDIRRYTGGLAREFNEVVQEFEKETETERTEWKEIGEGLSEATRSVTDAVAAARADAETPPDASAGPTPAVPATNGLNGGPPPDTDAPAPPAEARTPAEEAR
jgi:sec-independent protein translocase protein TatB